MDKAGIEQRLTQAWARHHSEPHTIENLRSLTGGAASATWCFDAVSKDGALPCILRTAQGAAPISTGLDKTTEAAVQAAACAAGVPAAPILFMLEPVDDLGQGYVMERLEGESIPQKIQREPRFRTATGLMTAQCANILHQIHRVDIGELHALPDLPAATQIDRYEGIYRDSGERLPCFELALRWLRQHCPPEDTSQLVHGDFRIGNFLVDAQSGITAVLDWELAHRGDPMEDLGWLCVNSWRFGRRDKPVGGFGQREELFAAYQSASGTTLDSQRVHFWELFGVLKWGIMCLYMTQGHLSGEERSVERAAIGRRVSETEIDILQLLQ